MDTLSLAYRPLEDRPFDRLRQVGYKHTAGGGYLCNERGPGGERILSWPQNGLLAVEGRIGAMLAQDEGDHTLVPAKRMQQAEGAANAVVREVLGWDPHPLTLLEVRRYDLAGELRFDRGDDGLAFLRTLATMCPARMRTTTERGADGQVQTVYVRTPKVGVIHQRFYDKGVESGTHPPGERIRIESQQRFERRQRRSAGAVGRSDLRSQFIRRMEPYVSETNDVIAAGTTGATDELLGRVAREELSMAKAERMLGSLVVLGRHGRSIYGTQQGQRRLRDLRSSGVALEAELPPDRVVPVGKLLRDLVEDFAP